MGGIADGVKNVNTSIVNNSTNAAAATANAGAAAKISSTNFSMLAGAASVAMGNIASKALMAGGSVLSSFTFGPIMDGFREYENQLNAVQTIQANTFSKGETTATINAALDELNAYADRTIYSFTEMTRNIGMFTSAGCRAEGFGRPRLRVCRTSQQCLAPLRSKPQRQCTSCLRRFRQAL